MVHYRTLPGCNGIESTRRLGRRHESNVLKTLAHPFHPKRGIRIEDDIFGSLIVEQLEYRISKFAPQFGFETAMLFIVRKAGIPLDRSAICVVFIGIRGIFSSTL